MTRRTILRLCVALLLPALAIASAVVPQLARPGGVSAQTTGSTVSICGLVSGYTAAGTSSTGSIAFSSPPASFVLAPGAVVTLGTGASTATGANVCLVGLVGANSQLTTLTITAAPTAVTQVTLCGTVSAYSTPGTTAGSITIGNVSYPIAVGAAAFTGTPAVSTGNNVCLTATLNGLGQITGGVSAANPTTTSTTPVNFCGTLQAYTAANGTVLATIVFSAPTASYTVASGVTVGNTTLATAGSLVCIVGQTNGTQLTSVTFVPTVSSTLNICGVVTAYVPASGTTAGSLTINGTTLVLAANSSLSSAITIGLNYCLVATLNGLQQATAVAVSVNQVATATATSTATVTPTATVTGTPATATATPTPVTLVICGVISNYLAAGTNTNGTLTINGTVVGIAPGAVFTGVTLAVNANVCISGTLNSTQQITTATVTQNAVTPTATTNVPPPPPPPGGTSTPTPTATAVPPTATATATAAPPTDTPVPAQPTATPKPAKAPKPTATTAPPPAQGPGPAPTPIPAPAKLPATGFGGAGAFAHNAAVGRVFRGAGGDVSTPLGIAAQPVSGGVDPMSPAVPAILGLTVIGLGVLARKVGIARR
jgi:hypothetical protein